MSAVVISLARTPFLALFPKDSLIAEAARVGKGIYIRGSYRRAAEDWPLTSDFPPRCEKSHRELHVARRPAAPLSPTMSSHRLGKAEAGSSILPVIVGDVAFHVAPVCDEIHQR